MDEMESTMSDEANDSSSKVTCDRCGYEGTKSLLWYNVRLMQGDRLIAGSLLCPTCSLTMENALKPIGSAAVAAMKKLKDGETP